MLKINYKMINVIFVSFFLTIYIKRLLVMATFNTKNIDLNNFSKLLRFGHIALLLTERITELNLN
jgi:hypothetical protein